MVEITHDETQGSSTGLQPLLHEFASCVVAPGLLLSDRDGHIRPGGVSGWFLRDVRLLDSLELSVEGSALENVGGWSTGSDRQRFAHVARGLGDRSSDPTVLVEVERQLTAEAMAERITVSSAAQDPVEVVLRLTAGVDLVSMDLVKRGERSDRLPGTRDDEGVVWERAGARIRLSADPAPFYAAVDDWQWRIRLERGQSQTITVTATGEVEGAFEHGGSAEWAGSDGVAFSASDHRLTGIVEQSLADLAGLLLDDAGDDFLAAGSPWFLTLFGRDSLWAARFMLPLAPDLALSTLRVLARRQGTRTDPATAEQPGKILHELRNDTLDLGAQQLPPVYYGTIDATPLWVLLLADAVAWGADPADVRELLPAARRCLVWQMEASRRSGWLRYVDETGTGLANQGWKDSHDSIQFADGRLAEPPIALCEVQAYAYEAAVRGAALLEEYGEEAVPGLLEWAAQLKERFGPAFLADSYPAIALDRHGARVDAITSNIGHLLGTGILDAAAVDQVAALLGSADLDSGFGLRTLWRGSPRFSRLSYHGGTVWPHDTAVAIRGLAAEGHLDVAAHLTAGLVRAAPAFGYRLPELYGGDSAEAAPRPLAYPAACRPQAWSAAAVPAALVALVGVRPTADGIATHERTDPALGEWRLEGVRAHGRRWWVAVAADGAVSSGPCE